MGVCAIVKVVMQGCPSQAELYEWRDRMRHAMNIGTHCEFEPEAYAWTSYPKGMHVTETEIVFDVNVWWRDNRTEITARVCGWLLLCMPAGSRVYYQTDHSYEYATEVTPAFLRECWQIAWTHRTKP